MSRYLLSTAAAVVAAMIASGVSANTLYFQMNPNFDTGGSRQAFVFGAANATGTVTGSGGFSQAFDLGAQGFAVITLPTNLELATGVIESKGFQISSSTNVSGYFLNRRTASTDMTYLIDGNRLGKDYVVAGYQNIREDQMSVQATVDNTKVTFTPKGGSAFDVVLNAGQTYLYTANSQLTGSRITSDQPIAVFSGNRCTNVPTGVSACDHIVEQMPSVDLLSKTYLLAQTPRTGANGNVVRVVATADATEVKFNGVVVATLNSGEFFEGRIKDGVQIDASNKVLVAQYLVGQGEAGQNTDPAMTIVPGSDQWLKSYVFASPSGTADFPTDFVSIVIGTADLGTLMIDGILADTSGFNALSTTAFSFGNIDVSLKSGPFSISAANPFQLLLSGFDSFDSYFTYGGAAFSPGASPPPPPPPPPPQPVDALWYWDGDAATNVANGVVDGGDGTWTATSLNFTDSTGTPTGFYNPQPGEVVFTGGAGLVTVDNSAGAINVLSMAFLVDGYRLVGGTIGLSGTAAAQVVAGATARIDSVLSGGALRKTDAGTLILGGANTFGDLFIEGGTVVVGTNTSAGLGLITLGDNTALASGMGGLTLANGIVTLGTGAIIAGPGDFTMDGGISGNGSITKLGAGNLVLNGANSFINLGIAEGTVSVGSNTGAGIGDIAIYDGATLAAHLSGLELANGIQTLGNGRIDAGPADFVFTLNGNITGAGSISQVGFGTLVLNGDNSFVNLGINRGTVVVGTNTAAGAGDIAINDNATLAAGISGLVLANGIQTTGTGLVDSGAGVFTLNGNITGPGSISQIGTGNLVLNGNNSFTNLGINQGTVTVGTNTAAGIGEIAINDNTTLAAGVSGLVLTNRIFTTGNGIVDSGDGVFTLAGNIGGAGSISQIGLGNLVLNGNNSFINLGINQGRVTVGTNTAAGAGEIAINNDAVLAAGANGLVLGNRIETTANGIVDAGPATWTFTLNGNIGGAGSISQVGLGNLVLNGNNSFRNLGINQGTVTLGSNTGAGVGDIAINDNATLGAGVSGLVVGNNIETTANGFISSGAGVFTLSGSIGGAGTITKIGAGRLVLTGVSSLAGATYVNAGRLQVDGSLANSVVTVRSGGSLGGTGTVGGVVALAGGTVAPGGVAPGAVIGTLNVAGNYAQASGSTYEVELASTGANDKIVVTGTAGLAAGSVLNVVKTDAARYPIGVKYNVLTAAGGVTGTYTVTGATNVSAFLDLTASYDPKNVYLSVGQTSSFASAGATPNQIAAATGVENVGNGALYNAIIYLPTDAAAQDAFDQISGEIHATMGSAAFEDSRFVREAVVNHLLAGGEDLRRGMWFGAYGSWGNFDGDGNAADARRDIGGFFIGADVVNSEAFTLGVLGGYGQADVRVNARNSAGSTDDWHLGAYGDFEAAGFAGRFGIDHMWRNVDTRRSVSFAGYSDALSASYQQTVFQLFGDVGYTIDLGGFGIEPFGALAYVMIDSDEIREAGGAAALTSADGVSEDYWVTTLGGRVSVGLPVGGGNFGLTAMAGWRHASGGDMNTPVNLRFASGPAFDIAGPPIAENAAALALSISAKIGPDVNFDFGYSGQVGEGLSDHGVRGALRYRF